MSTTSVDVQAEARTIRDVFGRWIGAIDSRDAAGTASFYAEDGMFMVPNSPPARGRDAIRTAWSGLLQTPNLSLKVEPATIEVAQAGDMAYELGTYQLGMDGPQGRVEDDGKYVVVWRKREGRWQVVADIFNSNRPLPQPAPTSAAR
jgi:uncharacterized protein (TIGR02246 family)